MFCHFYSWEYVARKSNFLFLYLKVSHWLWKEDRVKIVPVLSQFSWKHTGTSSFTEDWWTKYEYTWWYCLEQFFLLEVMGSIAGLYFFAVVQVVLSETITLILGFKMGSTLEYWSICLDYLPKQSAMEFSKKQHSTPYHGLPNHHPMRRERSY